MIQIINLTLATEAEKKNEIAYKNKSHESLESCAYEFSYLWILNGVKTFLRLGKVVPSFLVGA